MTRTIPHRSQSFPRRVPPFPLLLARSFMAALLGAALLGLPSFCAAQGSTQPAPSPQDSSTVQPNTHPAPTFHQSRNHVHPIPKKPQTPAETTPVIQALAAPVPEPPHWPANDQPAPARIVWDSQGLRIEAANSSLSEILTEVSSLTGAQVDGFATDARVYGQYGPGPARDVLSQLLEGTGYNVIMIGDLGQGAPRELVLTTRTAGAAPSAAHTTPAADDDADVDEPVQTQPQPNPLQPMRAPFNPAGMRNPREFPPDMQQRQQFPPGQQPQPGQPGQTPQQNQQ